MTPTMGKQMIEKTLRSLPAPYNNISEASVALVALIFENETEFYGYKAESYTHRHNVLGMMNMPKETFEWFIRDKVKYTGLNDIFIDVAMFFSHDYGIEDMYEAMNYNIALQILVTYFYLYEKNGGRPESIQDAILIYRNHWQGLASKSQKECEGTIAFLYS